MVVLLDVTKHVIMANPGHFPSFQHRYRVFQRENVTVGDNLPELVGENLPVSCP